MPVALILSSFVVANRIGGGAQQLVMAALGVEAFRRSCWAAIRPAARRAKP
jgi:hypothetical protein